MTEPSNNNPGQPPARPQGRPRLDAAFPSLRLMGAGVFLVVLGLVFSGWNIVHLDRQQSELNRGREDLARELAAFNESKAELPDLERRYAQFSTATAELTRERKILTEEVERLERQRTEVQKVLEESRSAYHLAQSAREAAQQELTEIMTEINSTRPMLVMLEARLKVLKGKEYSLREGLAESLTQKSQLAADLKGLEREREHAQALLERMLGDRKTLQDFSETVKASSRDLGQAAKEAEASAKKFVAVTSDLDQSTRALKTGAGDMAERIKNLEAQITQLSARNQSLNAAAAADEKTRRELKSQLDLLTGATASLSKAGKDLEGQARQWAQRSDQTLGEVGRVREALSPLPKSLEASLKSLAGAVEQLSAQARGLEGQATAMRTLTSPLQNQARDFSNTAKILQEEVNRSRESGQTLQQSLNELGESVEAARELLRQVSASLPVPDKPAAESPAEADPAEADQVEGGRTGGDQMVDPPAEPVLESE